MFNRIATRCLSRFLQHGFKRNVTSVQSSSVPPTFVRSFHSSLLRFDADKDETKKNPKNVRVTFVLGNGDRLETKGREGENFLDVVMDNDLDIDGFGACEGTCACSSCHIIFKEADFKKLKNPATDEEMDMLDLAFDLTDTSRLGCQVQLTKDMDGIVVDVPETINDARLV